MSDVLDLTVYGSPSACRTAATTAKDAATKLGTARTDLGSAVDPSDGFWIGPTGDRYRTRVGETREALQETKTAITKAADALETFASELDVAKTKMTRARTAAVDGGLAVSGDVITAPTTPPDDADDDTITAYNAKVDAWNAAVGHHDDGRIKEEEAHSNLESGMKAAIDVGWLRTLLAKLGILPEHGSDPVKLSGWGLGLTGTVGGTVAAWKVNSRYGTFSPRGPNGRFISPASLSRWQTGVRSMNSSNWKAKPYQAATRNKWLTGSKILSRAGGVLTFATSAYGQWQQDADDPSLSTAERVGRSGTVGGTAALGAWGGASLGAAIGTAIFPGAGTVIGGVLGGAIGGIAGSEVGEEIAEFGGDVAEGISDGLEDVGDTLKFW